MTVLEKHGDFLRDFRGDTVHPSTLQLLDELGLGDRFAGLPYSRLEEVAFPLDGGTVVVADFRRLRGRYRYVAMVPQWDLLTLLADAAEEEPSFTLRMRTEASDLLREESGRVRGVRYRTEDGATGEIRADLVVACDGRWSLARQQADLRVKELPVPIDAWWFRLPRAPEDEPALTPRAGRGRFAVIIPRTDFLQIAYIARKGTDPQLRARGIESFRQDVAALVPELAGRVGVLGSMDEVKHLDVRLNRLRRWYVDGLLCIGDAAHAMSPVGGVGINLAVQDAVAAARLLAEPLRHGIVTPRQLRAVQVRRLLPTVMVQGVQRLMHRGIVVPILEGRRLGPPGPVLAVLRRAPRLTSVTAYIIGVGVRPEHAPEFARRPASATASGS